MKKAIKNESSGQALAEMVLSIPLLFLMIAGMVQFSLLFLARAQFEHACGEAARQYASGLINNDSLKNEIWDNLGAYQNFFEKNSIQLTSDSPSSPIDRVASRFGRWLSPLSQALRNVGVDTPFSYGGFKWQVTAKCKISSFFVLIFGQGVVFKTQLAVIRFPK